LRVLVVAAAVAVGVVVLFVLFEYVIPQILPTNF
jgi:hypothetical protein